MRSVSATRTSRDQDMLQRATTILFAIFSRILLLFGLRWLLGAAAAKRHLSFRGS